MKLSVVEFYISLFPAEGLTLAFIFSAAQVVGFAVWTHIWRSHELISDICMNSYLTFAWTHIWLLHVAQHKQNKRKGCDSSSIKETPDTQPLKPWLPQPPSSCCSYLGSTLCPQPVWSPRPPDPPVVWMLGPPASAHSPCGSPCPSVPRQLSVPVFSAAPPGSAAASPLLFGQRWSSPCRSTTGCTARRWPNNTSLMLFAWLRHREREGSRNLNRSRMSGFRQFYVTDLTWLWQIQLPTLYLFPLTSSPVFHLLFSCVPLIDSPLNAANG